MIKQYRLKLKPENDDAFPSLSGYYLYGTLLELLDSEYVELLHSNGFSPISQYIRKDRNDNTIEWVVSLLNREAANQISPALEEHNSFKINSCNCQLTVKDLTMTVIPSDEHLVERARSLPDILKPSMEFITPTSFKANNEYQLFPSTEYIIRNLVNRWNSYSQSYIIDDEDAILSLIQSVKIAGYRLQSSYYRMKGTHIPGFMGEIRLSTRMSLPIAELFKILLYFSEYSGVGIKTSLGMGATKIRLDENTKNA